MIRISLIVCVSLIFGITAKPWNKLTDESFQDTVMSIDDDGKMSWAAAVEPPEDMDETQYEIDPRMRIWKSMQEEPEQDWDDVYHKATEEIQKLLAPLGAEYEEGVEVRGSFLEPEKDEDDLYHRGDQQSPVQMESVGQEMRDEEGWVRVHLEPEQDMDDLYHKDLLVPVFHQDAEPAAPAYLPSPGRYSEPEEDLDDLYHQ